MHVNGIVERTSMRARGVGASAGMSVSVQLSGSLVSVCIPDAVQVCCESKALVRGLERVWCRCRERHEATTLNVQAPHYSN